MKILLAGQWVGEFGWELFCWQGYIRRLSKNYDKTIIVSRKGHKFLYKDFCDEYFVLDSPTSKANMFLGETNHKAMNELIRKYNPTFHKKPFNIGYTASHLTTMIASPEFYKQDYYKYKSNSIDKKYDILVHARNKVVGSDRNWTLDNWKNLIDLLSKKYKIATIGSNEAYGFKEVDDYRGCSIEDSVSLMNRCGLVIGQSSGPLHLASLSGAQHFVWSHIKNKLRYEEHWNPFKTKVIFYHKEGWNPKPENIFNEINKAIYL